MRPFRVSLLGGYYVCVHNRFKAGLLPGSEPKTVCANQNKANFRTLTMARMQSPDQPACQAVCVEDYSIEWLKRVFLCFRDVLGPDLEGCAKDLGEALALRWQVFLQALSCNPASFIQLQFCGLNYQEPTVLR